MCGGGSNFVRGLLAVHDRGKCQHASRASLCQSSSTRSLVSPLADAAHCTSTPPPPPSPFRIFPRSPAHPPLIFVQPAPVQAEAVAARDAERAATQLALREAEERLMTSNNRMSAAQNDQSQQNDVAQVLSALTEVRSERPPSGASAAVLRLCVCV